MTLLTGFRRKDSLLLFITGLSWVILYAVAKPGYSYSHYFTYLIIPLPLITGYLLQSAGQRKRRGIVFLAAILFFCFSLSYFNLRDSYQTGLYRETVSNTLNFRKNKVAQSPLSKELILLRASFPNISKLVNFDWYPEIHTETGLLLGTHFSVPERLFGYQVSDSQSTSFSRHIFLEDLKKNRPEIVLIPTTTERSYYDFTYNSFHRIPEIKAYIDTSYSFYKNVDEVNIMLRNDFPKPASAGY
ncbi:MAG: hypothetical protein LRY55_11940 [Leadbetterella sp.]|nr:hypothetical protein [Leadbetterella sp.]